MKDNPRISAVVLYHNDSTAKEALQCVQALRDQTIAQDLEIILVDNHTPETTYTYVQQAIADEPDTRVLRMPRNVGFGAGNNAGADHARGTYLLILNPDSHPEPNAVEQLLKPLEEESSIGMSAGKLVFPDSTVRDSHRPFPTLLSSFLHRLQAPQPPTDVGNTAQDVDWAVGACLCIRKDLFDRLGKFDERYFLFFEDSDLCRTCWQYGKRVVYVPQSVFRDRKERLSGRGILPLVTTRIGRSHLASYVKYFWKWRGQPLPRQK